MNVHITPFRQLTQDDLQAQFQLCQKWQNADQWDHLAMAYYQFGFLLNALRCFRLADACRVPVATETEIP